MASDGDDQVQDAAGLRSEPSTPFPARVWTSDSGVSYLDDRAPPSAGHQALATRRDSRRRSPRIGKASEPWMGDSPARDPGFSSGVDVGDERIPKTESPGAQGRVRVRSPIRSPRRARHSPRRLMISQLTGVRGREGAKTIGTRRFESISRSPRRAWTRRPDCRSFHPQRRIRSHRATAGCGERPRIPKRRRRFPVGHVVRR